VRNSGPAACRIDAHNPQRAEISLLQPPPYIAVAQRLFYGFLRRPVQLRFGEEVTLSSAKGLVAIISPVGTSFYSGHVFSLSSWERIRSPREAQARARALLTCSLKISMRI